MKIKTNDFKSNQVFKILRENLDKTQVELAKDLNISRSTLQKYEYGINEFPFEIFNKIAKTYDLIITIENNSNKI